MITKRGVGFVLVAIVLFLIASATNVGWVRIFDAVLWGMLLLSLLLQWLSITRVDVTRRLLAVVGTGAFDGPTEDDAVESEVRLHNRWFWPRFFISLAYDAPMESPDSREQRLFVANLHGHGDVMVASRINCYRRGLHEFGPIEVQSLVPFGLFRKRKRKAAPLSLFVYPKVFAMQGMALIQNARGESQTARRSRAGQEAVGSREYHQGDPLRHVHWRNSARLGRLAVKEMEESADESVSIVFDPGHDVGQGRETTLEYSIKLAAAVGVQALASGESVNLVAGRVGGLFADAEPFLRELAMLEAMDSPPVSELLAGLDRNSVALVVLHAGDREALQAVLAVVGEGPGIAAVILGGFAENDGPDAAADALRERGVPVAVCRRGGIEQAIAELEGTEGGSDSVMVGHSWIGREAIE